ncbi:metal-dependent hydrolase family protein [Actinospica sp.]|uniref:metal-dependent hydrolase family protein n=1 Tax=Actinospica sp. TaxID=1872142 RepID=UPI002B523847|nr:amidohydrolase family protein [Actinospica sp.]HWG26751.1 amidohydrolase family protein [Actinospica sp.]
MPEVLTAPRVMTGDETVSDGAVVVGDRTVQWAGRATALPGEYAVLPRADYPGSTITPGLIDCHVHLGFDGGPNPAARMRAETDAQQLVLMLRSARDLLGVGVTTARDLGGRAYLGVVVRDAIAADLARGPRLVVAGSPITVTGGHCWFMGAEADSEDDLRRMVRTHHKRGVDLIKVMSTGGFMTSGSAPWYAQFTGAQLAVIVEEAGRVDKPVAAHAHGIEGIRRAVEAGVTTIEHCSWVTETNERNYAESLAAQIAEQGIFVCPTINVNAPYVAELTGIAVGEHLQAMHELGIRLIAGTDAGVDNTPHHQYLGALEYYVTLGFRPEDVLAMATTEAAAALGLGAVAGRIAPGYDADLLVVDGDPRADISALGRLQRVIARGRAYVPDSGRFDVSAPGTPFASGEHAVDLRLLTEATKRREI